MNYTTARCRASKRICVSKRLRAVARKKSLVSGSRLIYAAKNSSSSGVREEASMGPSPVRSHVSDAPKHKQTSLICCSLSGLFPASSIDRYAWVTPIFWANSICLSPRFLRSSFSLSFIASLYPLYISISNCCALINNDISNLYLLLLTYNRVIYILIYKSYRSYNR